MSVLGSSQINAVSFATESPSGDDYSECRFRTQERQWAALKDLAETKGRCVEFCPVSGPDVPSEMGEADEELVAMVANGGVDERVHRSDRMAGAAITPDSGSTAAIPSCHGAQKLHHAASKRKSPRTEHFHENTAFIRPASGLTRTLP